MKKKFCKNCQIEIEKDRSHCPICGNIVDKSAIGTQREYENFPSYKNVGRNRIKLELALLIGFAVFVLGFGFLEYLIMRSFKMTGYFLAGLTYTYLVFVLPFAHNYSFSLQASLDILLTTGLLIFLEFYTHSFGWGLQFAVPFFLMASSIVVYAIMLSRGYYKRSSLYPSFLCLILTTILFTFNFNVLKKLALWPILASFATCAALFATLFIFARNKIIKGLKKDFFM